MKKILAIAAILFSLTGCGSNNHHQKDANQSILDDKKGDDQVILGDAVAYSAEDLPSSLKFLDGHMVIKYISEEGSSLVTLYYGTVFTDGDSVFLQSEMVEEVTDETLKQLLEVGVIVRKDKTPAEERKDCHPQSYFPKVYQDFFTKVFGAQEDLCVFN